MELTKLTHSHIHQQTHLHDSAKSKNHEHEFLKKYISEFLKRMTKQATQASKQYGWFYTLERIFN